MEMPFPSYMESGSSDSYYWQGIQNSIACSSKVVMSGPSKVEMSAFQRSWWRVRIVRPILKVRGFLIDRVGILGDERFGAPKTTAAPPVRPQPLRAPSTFSLSQKADSTRLAAVFTVSSWRARSRMRAAIARRSSA